MIEKISTNESQNEFYSIRDDGDCFLACIPKKTTLDDFLTVAKVKNDSYSANLIKRLYNGLFISDQNVSEEYQKYYLKEYENIVDFLFWKYFVPKDISRQFISQMAPNEILLYGNRFSIVYTFLETEIMSESLKNIILEIGKIEHENTD
jgi:hypothetical protein